MITIADRFQDPLQSRFWPAYSAFPKLHDPPTLLQQLVTVTDVACDVLGEFLLPEVCSGLGGGGIAAAGMPVPVASVNEYADLVTSKHYVWSSRKAAMVQPIPEAMPMQQLPDFHLRRCIAAADASHHARPDFFADYVHYRFPAEPGPS